MLTSQFLADAVLLLHFCIAAFVLGALPLVVAGNLAGWQWVNGWYFRVGHVAAIGVVVAESWLGLTCPLTTYESWLRASAGDEAYSGSFVGHWVARLLFYDAAEGLFTAAYTVFALLVALAWWVYPPGPGAGHGRRTRRSRGGDPDGNNPR